MDTLEYRLRPHVGLTLAGAGLACAGFALAWWSPMIGLLLGIGFLLLLVGGVLPYYVRQHRAVIGLDHVIVPGGLWFHPEVRIAYDDIAHLQGTLAAGDSRITIVGHDDRRYGINADLLPTRDAFELVVAAVTERIGEVRRRDLNL